MKAKYICQCEKISEPEKVLNGSLVIELACWFLALAHNPLWIIAGVANHIYRHTDCKLRCPWCKQDTIFLLDSLQGAILCERLFEAQQQKEQQSNSGE